MKQITSANVAQNIIAHTGAVSTNQALTSMEQFTGAGWRASTVRYGQAKREAPSVDHAVPSTVVRRRPAVQALTQVKYDLVEHRALFDPCDPKSAGSGAAAAREAQRVEPPAPHPDLCLTADEAQEFAVPVGYPGGLMRSQEPQLAHNMSGGNVQDSADRQTYKFVGTYNTAARISTEGANSLSDVLFCDASERPYACNLQDLSDVHEQIYDIFECSTKCQLSLL